jgi:hypothetical protein
MKEKRNLHLKVQEMCECYATADPLKSMSQMVDEADAEEAAVKWIALAALHGINANAKKIKISQAGDSVRVSAVYQSADLPAPSSAIAEKIIAAIREITHIDADEGRLPLSLGVGGSSIDIEVKVKSKNEKNKVTLKFSD